MGGVIQRRAGRTDFQPRLTLAAWWGSATQTVSLGFLTCQMESISLPRKVVADRIKGELIGKGIKNEAL